MASFQVQFGSWDSPLGREALNIRIEVFVKEQRVPLEEEEDAQDPAACHAIAYDADGQAQGTGRLFGEPRDPQCARIGRMAVRREARRTGCGSALLAALIGEARRRGFQRAVLSAQVHAIPFYERHGFQVISEEYLDAGIPHRAMERVFDDAGAAQ